VTAKIDERLSTPRARNPMDRVLQGSEEFLIELGRLVTAAALVENEMETIIRWLLQPKYERGGEMITADMDFRRKANMVRTLISEFPNRPIEYDEVASIMLEVHRLYDERNEFIHGIWERSLIRGQRRLRRATARDGKLRATLRTVAPDDIRRLADKLANCAERIDEALLRSLL
jgi:hypothetical protein